MFDLSASSLFASLIWGAIGSGFAIFGKKQRAGIPLAGGLALIAISYFISSWALMSLAGFLILVVMYWLKKQGYEL